MKIVIDISDEDYKRIKDMPDAFNSLTSRVYKSIKNGTPLPKGHGRLIDADEYEFDVLTIIEPDLDRILEYLADAETIIEADKEAKE